MNADADTVTEMRRLRSAIPKTGGRLHIAELVAVADPARDVSRMSFRTLGEPPTRGAHSAGYVRPRPATRRSGLSSDDRLVR
jgi:hypothetical protein